MVVFLFTCGFCTAFAEVQEEESLTSKEWELMLQNFRGEIDFEDPNSTAFACFQKVKRVGTMAYPPLIGLIDHDDPAIGRAAVAVLIRLTGRDSKLPNDGTKDAIKKDWLQWLPEELLIPTRELVDRMICDEPESEVRRLVQLLGDDDPDVRTTAATKLESCALRHRKLLRSLVAGSDSETCLRLESILEGKWFVLLEERAQAIEKNPRLLLEFLRKQDEKSEEFPKLRARVEAVYRTLKSKAAETAPPRS